MPTISQTDWPMTSCCCCCCWRSDRQHSEEHRTTTTPWQAVVAMRNMRTVRLLCYEMLTMIYVTDFPFFFVIHCLVSNNSSCVSKVCCSALSDELITWDCTRKINKSQLKQIFDVFWFKKTSPKWTQLSSMLSVHHDIIKRLGSLHNSDDVRKSKFIYFQKV